MATENLPELTEGVLVGEVIEAYANEANILLWSPVVVAGWDASSGKIKVAMTSTAADPKVIGVAVEQEFWTKTHDKYGLKPREKIICPICKTEMVFRFMSLNDYVSHNIRAYTCSIAYKCPKCDFVAKFDIPISKEYYEFLMKLTGGTGYYEPIQDWQEYEIIKKRLEALGYW